MGSFPRKGIDRGETYILKRLFSHKRGRAVKNSVNLFIVLIMLAITFNGCQKLDLKPQSWLKNVSTRSQSPDEEEDDFSETEKFESKVETPFVGDLCGSGAYGKRKIRSRGIFNLENGAILFHSEDLNQYLLSPVSGFGKGFLWISQNLGKMLIRVS